MFINLLESLGLSKKEANMYLKLLEIGAEPVSIIAKNCNLNRTTTYHVLQELSEKGLVNSFIKRKILHYNANSPEQFLVYIKEKKEKLKKDEILLLNNLNILKNITEKKSIKSKIQFFDGFEGAKAVYLHSLTASETIKSFWGINSIPSDLYQFVFNEYVALRVKKNIKIETITQENELAYKIAETNKKHLRESYYFKEKLPLDIKINIYDSTIAIITYKDNNYSGVIIENEKIAEALKTLHTLIKSYCILTTKQKD